MRKEFIEAAWKERPEVDDWPVLAERPGQRKSDPKDCYRGWSYERPFPAYLEDADGEGMESMEELRFEVVYSDALAKKFDAALPRRMAKEEERLTKAAARAGRKGFQCEEDARKAAEALASRAKYHTVAASLLSETRPVKRDRPGRPRKDEVQKTTTTWRFELTFDRDDERIAALRRRRSCFVLITDWSTDDWDDQRVLDEYRHQKLIEGHQGFRGLKGPAAVAPVFLKTPSRICAMGFVLMLGLMVRNYMQAVIRHELAAREETLTHPFTKKEEPYLTPEMAFEHFECCHRYDGGLLRHSDHRHERWMDPVVEAVGGVVRLGLDDVWNRAPSMGGLGLHVHRRRRTAGPREPRTTPTNATAGKLDGVRSRPGESQARPRRGSEG